MKKLIVLFVLVAFTGVTVAELHSIVPGNNGFEDGIGTWGSGSGSGSSGVQAWSNYWAFVETTGGANGSQNFMNTSTGDPNEDQLVGLGLQCYLETRFD